MTKSKIIVCAHKQDFMAQNDVYMPLQVGKALSNVDRLFFFLAIIIYNN